MELSHLARKSAGKNLMLFGTNFKVAEPAFPASISPMLPSDIVDNATLHRFELHEDGKTAFLIYERLTDSIRLVHTEVPSALRGKGVGSRLVEGVIHWAEHNKVRVIPLCPFVIDYLKAHPEHLHVVDENYKKLVQGA